MLLYGFYGLSCYLFIIRLTQDKTKFLNKEAVNVGNNYWQSENIRLRSFSEKDIEVRIEKMSTPNSRQQFFWDHMTFPLSKTEIEKDSKEMLESPPKDDKKLLVVETLDGKYVGEILIWKTDRRNGVMSYGIFIEDEYKGKRFGTEALIIVLDYYFNELNYQKAAPVVYSFNIASQMFHEKFGFIREGELRNELYARGEYHNVICYGMLRDEFNKKHKHDFIVDSEIEK